MDRRSQAFGATWSGLQAFGGIRGLSCITLLWHAWIVVHKHLVATSGVYKPLVADAVFYKPSVAYVDGRSQALGGRWSHLQAFRGIRGSSCRSLWWYTWIVVCKFLVAYVDRRSQAFGGRWSRLQAFGGIRGLSCISLSWHTWIVVCKASGGGHGSLCRSLWWLT